MATASSNTSWEITASIGKDVSWDVLTSLTDNASWQIATSFVKDVSWGLQEGVTLDTTWRIQPALTDDVIWQMVETLSVDATWQIKKSPNVSTSWKIIETDGDTPGINSHVVSVTAGGTPIDPKSISLKTDLDSLAWSASLVLTTQTDYDLCTDGESIVITIDGMTWYLDINERGASEVFVEDG